MNVAAGLFRNCLSSTANALSPADPRQLRTDAKFRRLTQYPRTTHKPCSLHLCSEGWPGNFRCEDGILADVAPNAPVLCLEWKKPKRNDRAQTLLVKTRLGPTYPMIDHVRSRRFSNVIFRAVDLADVCRRRQSAPKKRS